MIIDSSGKQVEAYILHLPGRGKLILPTLLKREKENKVTIIDDISIITTASPDTEDECSLIAQLKSNNINYINSASHYDKEWRKTAKLSLIFDALNSADKEYSLVMDANDVAILKSIDDEFVEKWKGYFCDVLFNGSQYLYPKMLAAPIDKENESPFVNHYLNAGVCFGYTKAIKDLYEKALYYLNNNIYEPYESEQYYIRIATVGNVKCKIDDGSHLFLLSHGN